jgi:hypothetical protein
MRRTIQNLLAGGIVVALAVPALAQPAIGPAAQSAPQTQGAYGGASAVQPGAGAGAAQPNPTGQPIVPQNNTSNLGQGPYGGANAVLPQQPASPTGPNPALPNVAGNASLTGPYGGFAAVGPPRLVAAPLTSPSLVFPGAGVPIASLQQAGLIGGAFPGQTAVNGVVTSLPIGAANVNNVATATPSAIQPAGVVQPGAAGPINPPQTSGNVQGQGPYGGANAVLPQQPASPTGTGVPGVTPTPGAARGISGPYGGFEAVQPAGFTSSRPTLGGTPAAPVTATQQTTVNPVFTRFFTGLNAAVTPSGTVVTPTP